MSDSSEQIKQLEAAISSLEAQRPVLGDSVVELALAPLRQQLAGLRLALPTASMPILEGERKLVTVMFADISGFTAIAEKLDPEQVRNLMNGCFDCLVPAVKKYGGWVDKFIGDAILALFGAPVAYEDHAERALRAALEMLERLAAFNAQYDTTLDVHVGINSGLVIAGGIGSQGQQQYSVMGDTVNLAARLEDVSEAGQVLVGPNTYRVTASLFEYETLPSIRVKGKNEPVPLYCLLGLKAAPGLRRGIGGLRSPLVGRDAEMDQLQAAVSDLQSGRGNIISLVGEAGLGKSRLVAEVRQALTFDLTWAEGRALSYTQDISYWIARDLLSSFIGVEAHTPLAEVEAALRQSVARLFPDESRALRVHPYLARLLDVPLDEITAEQVRHLSPEAWQGRMFQAIQEYLRRQSQAQPVVLVWEDLHWADPSSLHLLEILLPLTNEIPLLLLLVFRTRLEGQVWNFHERTRLAHEASYQVINLAPLNQDESTQLVRTLLKIENFPEETRRLILNKAEGNPFFLEELLRSLLDAGIVVLEEEKAIVTRAVAEIQLPDTLQEMIAARIDRLPSTSKRTLQTASVIGRIFQQRVLAYILAQEQSHAHLNDSLSELQRRELIHLREAGAASGQIVSRELEYIFKHAVTQETAYNSLLIARRKTLHQVAAEAIEALFSDHLNELAATLAYHYEQAGVAGKAIHYLSRAADRARATYANAEAITSYQRAIDQLQELGLDEEHAERWRAVAGQLLEGLGDVLAVTAQHIEAIAAYQKALAQVADNAIRQSCLQRKIGYVLVYQRLYDEALQAYGRAETSLGPEPIEPPPEWRQEWLMIQLARLSLRYWQGEVREMTLLAKQMRSAVEQYGTPLQRSDFFSNLAAMNLRRDRYIVSDETLTYARMGAAASREWGDPNAISTTGGAQFLLGFTQLWHGDLDDAEEQLRTSLQEVEQTGRVSEQSRCLTYLTIVQRKRGQIEEARQYALRSLAAATAA
jgi:class 3 adenylate cyclase/tetratricopeptide (TPR) repeat protein/ABC-type dipeptide/oligopeptide/nickel transport system ATPase component